MSIDYLQNMSELEEEFKDEIRGFGSLAVVLVSTSESNNSDEGSNNKGGFIGYDICPEDIEALYFDGLGTPRWESIKADSVAEQMDIYNDSMQKVMSNYPMINRVSDTDQKVEYDPEEVLLLQTECEKVLGATENPKAMRALKKFLLACHKALTGKMGLLLTPN
jgi:hypothetical protein